MDISQVPGITNIKYLSGVGTVMSRTTETDNTEHHETLCVKDKSLYSMVTPENGIVDKYIGGADITTDSGLRDALEDHENWVSYDDDELCQAVLQVSIMKE